MFKWLLPREANFFDFFEKHIFLIIEAARELHALVSEASEIGKRAEHITRLEHEADSLARQCIEELHKTFITPFQREDLYHLISTMDDIIDLIEDTAQRFVIYKLHNMTPEISELTLVLLNATEVLQKILIKLRNIKDIEKIRLQFKEVNQLEKMGDAAYLKAIAHLFDEHGSNPVTIIKWKEIYENLENAIDRCKNVANIIEGVILESS